MSLEPPRLLLHILLNHHSSSRVMNKTEMQHRTGGEERQFDGVQGERNSSRLARGFGCDLNRISDGGFGRDSNQIGDGGSEDLNRIGDESFTPSRPVLLILLLLLVLVLVLVLVLMNHSCSGFDSGGHGLKEMRFRVSGLRKVWDEGEEEKRFGSDLS